MKKSTVIQTLNELPQKFDLDELLERLMVIEKIDEALEDAKSRKTVSHDKVKKMVAIMPQRESDRNLLGYV